MLPPDYVNSLALLLDVQEAVHALNRDLGCDGYCATEPYDSEGEEIAQFDITTLLGYCGCE